MRHKFPVYAWLTLLMTVFFAVGLGHYALIDPDEGRYGEIAREMAASHQWIIPILNGVPCFHKPILFYWLAALSLKIFGVSVWALRLVPLFSSVFGCMCVYFTGKLLFDERAGIFAAVILATMPLFFGAAHYANMDALVAALITATLCCFLLASELPEKHPARAWCEWGTWFFAALGVLAKGLIGIVLPGFVGLVWLLTLKRWRRLITISWFSGSLLFLVISAPWFIAAEHKAPGFLHYFFVTQQFTRYLGNQFNNVWGWWFYLPVVFAGALPWTAVILVAIYNNVRLCWIDRMRHPREYFLLLWPALIWLFFSVPSSKIVGYSLPILPPLALLAGIYFNRYWQSAVTPRLLRAFLSFFSVLGILAMIILIFIWQHDQKQLHLPMSMSMVLLMMIFLITFMCILILFYRQRLRRVFYIVTAMIGFILLIAMSQMDVLVSNSMQTIAAQISKQDKNADVVMYQQYFFSLPFYLQKPSIVVADWQDPTLLAQDNWHEQLGAGLHYPKALHQNYWTDNEFWRQWQKRHNLIIVTLPEYLPAFLEKKAVILYQGKEVVLLKAS